MHALTLFFSLVGLAAAKDYYLPPYEKRNFITSKLPMTDYPPACTNTICVDYIDDCGQTYGGCYNDCGMPTFTTPYCDPTPTATPTKIPFYPRDDTTPTPGPSTSYATPATTPY